MIKNYLVFVFDGNQIIPIGYFIKYNLNDTYLEAVLKITLIWMG